MARVQTVLRVPLRFGDERAAMEATWPVRLEARPGEAVVVQTALLRRPVRVARREEVVFPLLGPRGTVTAVRVVLEAEEQVASRRDLFRDEVDFFEMAGFGPSSEGRGRAPDGYEHDDEWGEGV